MGRSLSRMWLSLTCLATAALAEFPRHYNSPGSIDATTFVKLDHRRHVHRLMRSAQAPLSFGAGGTATGIIVPTDYGADPTGAADSSGAFDKAVAAMLDLGNRETLEGQTDLGGAVLDLSGGIYNLSRPIMFPHGYASFRVQRGTLMAGPSFPAGEYILQIGDDEDCKHTTGGKSNKNCMSNVGVQQVTLAGMGRAFGGLMVQNTMDANVGPAVMVTGFSGVGINLAGTGAGFIHECWLGQFEPGDKTPRDDATATGILLAGAQHDAMVTNVIVFSGRVGVNSTNGANRLQGVHTWNLKGSSGGYGIVLWKGSGRVQQSYLDYAPLVIRGSDAQPCMVEGNLFLGSSTIVLAATQPSSTVARLTVTGNVFHTWNAANTTLVLDETEGKFTAVVDTVVEGSQVGTAVAKVGKVGTRATVTAPVVGANTTVRIGFGDALLFGLQVGIDESSISCQLHGPWATALSSMVDPLQLNNVIVTLKDAAPAHYAAAGGVAVTCTVDQSRRSCAAH